MSNTQVTTRKNNSWITWTTATVATARVDIDNHNDLITISQWVWLIDSWLAVAVRPSVYQYISNSPLKNQNTLVTSIGTKPMEW